eukprot:gene28277-35029_t
MDVYSLAESDKGGSPLGEKTLMLRTEGSGGEENEGAHLVSRFEQVHQPQAPWIEEEEGLETHNMATTNPLFTASVQQAGDE